MPSFRILKSVTQPLPLVVTFLGLISILGIGVLDFDVTWWKAGAVAISSIATELLLRKLFRKPLIFPYSALAAAFGIIIFFRASTLGFFVLAGVIAIASKFFVKIPRQGHVFNPSNFAIVLLVVLFPGSATIEFTQWGTNPYVLASISVLALLVAWRARVLVTTGSFLLAYVVGLLLFLPYTEALTAHHYGLISPSLIFLAAFMLTDPRTAPIRTSERILHGVSVALLFFVLEFYGLRYALFLAPFIIACFKPPSGLLAFLLESRYRAFRLKNFASFLAIVFLGGFTFASASDQPARYSSGNISPEFLLQGVESSSLLACTQERSFGRNVLPELQNTHETYGATWGDYDGDGFEDLFISYRDAPSKLFRNLKGDRFTDVTSTSGLPTLSSASALFVDYDNDGDLDLFVVLPHEKGWRETYWSQEESLAQDILAVLKREPVSALRVFENQGASFREVTTSLDLARFLVPESLGGSLSVADYDNDGDLDLFYSQIGRRLFLVNENIALRKTLFDAVFGREYTLTCGDTTVVPALRDLFEQDALNTYFSQGGCVAIIHPAPPLDLSFSSPEERFADPASVFVFFTPQPLYVLENQGTQFTWKEVPLDLSRLPDSPYTARVGSLEYPLLSGMFYQPVSFDYDDDGLPDVFVASDFGGNLLLKNQGDLSFEDVTLQSGISALGSGMGVASADFDGNGREDLFVTNVQQDFLFYGNDQGFEFSGLSFDPLAVGWGVTATDFDLDGKEDLAIANGDTTPSRNTPLEVFSRRLFRVDQLYKNVGDSFGDVTWQTLCPPSQSGRPLAVADYDNDGDEDIFIGNLAYEKTGDELYVSKGTEMSNFLSVSLEGKESNRMGIGTQVSVVTAGGKRLTKWVRAGGSFYSQNSTRLIFGLGNLDTAVALEILWPSGRKSYFESVVVNQHIKIQEGSSDIVSR